MSGEVVSLIVGVLGFVSGVAGLLFARRKVAAEREKILAEAEAIRSGKENTDVDAFDKFSDMLKKLQDRNSVLYEEKVILEKAITEKDRSIETLADRLESRDTQLAAATKQLGLLQDLAREAPITQTLRDQLVQMNTMVEKFQEAQAQATRMLQEKDRIVQSMFDTNRNLEMKKPQKVNSEP